MAVAGSALADYKNDKDFWHNLPATFDILTCCYRQYVWTRDVSNVRDPDFLNFYDRTVSDYVKRWDKDGDGVPESYTVYGHRGIGSYDEQDLRDNPSAAVEYRGNFARHDAGRITSDDVVWGSPSCGGFVDEFGDFIGGFDAGFAEAMCFDFNK